MSTAYSRKFPSYHPVLILHIQNPVSTVKVITEERRKQKFLISVGYVFSFFKFYSWTIYLEYISWTDRCRLQSLIINL